MLDQVISLFGAAMVLGAYIANLAHRLDRDGALYAALNMFGAGTLAFVAAKTGSLGLTLIEASWALVSAWALSRALLARRRA